MLTYIEVGLMRKRFLALLSDVMLGNGAGHVIFRIAGLQVLRSRMAYVHVPRTLFHACDAG